MDLYQQNNDTPGSSPPQQPPSKTSPPMKRANSLLPSPNTSAKSSPAVANNNIPVLKGGLPLKEIPPPMPAQEPMEGNSIPSHTTTDTTYNSYPPYNYNYPYTGYSQTGSVPPPINYTNQFPQHTYHYPPAQRPYYPPTQ